MLAIKKFKKHNKQTKYSAVRVMLVLALLLACLVPVCTLGALLPHEVSYILGQSISQVTPL